MGILNVTPDSFYDGGQHNNSDLIIEQVKTMLNEGATFIDVGGYSSRPGAQDVSQDEEIQRVIPIIKLIVDEFPDVLISVDTFRSAVAEQAVKAGACMINDISAGHLDDTMLKTVAHLKVPYVMMHMRGNPKTMATLTNYENLVKDILFYFSERITKARALGIVDLIIDPGFGFAKTVAQNYELLNKFELLKMTDLPILAGLSRKSMIYKTLNFSAEDALNGTTILNTIALQKGADILRVHDVKEAMECVKLTQQLH
ncbi:dihydropteroate synthase [Psychroserpens damuponensis]|uniref:dihydropteroate synthase n=1 Tax=Psychroserpens damuponensis TaxID=943936 RepID=UPI000694E9FC|nr:dihydropteroate synthase [Psychroserpens damuponensis]